MISPSLISMVALALTSVRNRVRAFAFSGSSPVRGEILR